MLSTITFYDQKLMIKVLIKKWSKLPWWLYQWNLSTTKSVFWKNSGSLFKQYACKLQQLSQIMTDGAKKNVNMISAYYWGVVHLQNLVTHPTFSLEYFWKFLKTLVFLNKRLNTWIKATEKNELNFFPKIILRAQISRGSFNLTIDEFVKLCNSKNDFENSIFCIRFF